MSADAAQKEVLEAADERVAVAEGQRIADDGPEDGDQAHHGEALHHGAEDVLLAHQAAVEERQAGAGHQQHQRRGDQHPGVVAGGLRVLDGLLEGGDLGLRYRGLCGWVGDGRGNGHREMARNQEEEQQLQRTRGQGTSGMRSSVSNSRARGVETGLSVAERQAIEARPAAAVFERPEAVK